MRPRSCSLSACERLHGLELRDTPDGSFVSSTMFTLLYSPLVIAAFCHRTLRPASSGPHRAVLHDAVVVDIERPAVVDGADGETVVPSIDHRVVGTQVAEAPG